jgi:[ribosomal protein S18]-alanine N-acetyltransferase
MTQADVDAVMAVEVRAYSHPWSRGNFIDSLRAGHVAELLVNDDGRVCAYFVAMVGVDELHLLNITVAPEEQGSGLGQRLMQTVRLHAQSRQLSTLWLEVRQSNHRARQLYARLGFAEVGLRKGYYPAAPRREDAVVMRLPLQAAVAEAPAAVVQGAPAAQGVAAAPGTAP